MDARDRIIYAAMKTFLQKGYEATSINDVAEQAALSKGGIYHHFINKESLFIECVNFMFEKLQEWEINLFSEENSVRDLIRRYFLSLSEMNDVICDLAGSASLKMDNFYLLMMEAFTKFPEKKEKHDQTHKSVKHFLEERLKLGQERGEIKADLDSETLAFLINALAEGTMIHHILNEPLDLKIVGEKLSMIIWEGLSQE
jgi:AcrR family transcriptional regulator